VKAPWRPPSAKCGSSEVSTSRPTIAKPPPCWQIQGAPKTAKLHSYLLSKGSGCGNVTQRSERKTSSMTDSDAQWDLRHELPSVFPSGSNLCRRAGIFKMLGTSLDLRQRPSLPTYLLPGTGPFVSWEDTPHTKRQRHPCILSYAQKD
jgi:hypothetical protein